jgi:hypothetical protein
MRYQVASVEQRSANYVVSSILLRQSGDRDWYFASGEVEDIQINARTPSANIFSGFANSVQSVCARPLTITPSELQFHQLVKQWHRERGVTSSPVQMAMCPAYQQIIAMGESVIPLILCELESEANDPDHWFWALRALTGADPVPVDDRGDTKKMASAWLDWGRLNLYAW